MEDTFDNESEVGTDNNKNTLIEDITEDSPADPNHIGDPFDPLDVLELLYCDQEEVSPSDFGLGGSVFSLPCLSVELETYEEIHKQVVEFNFINNSQNIL